MRANFFRAVLASFIMLAVMRAPLAAQDGPAADPAGKPTDPATSLTIARAVAPSLARVAISLRYDKGEASTAQSGRYRCPNCDNWHFEDTASLVDEERPMEFPAYVLSSTRVAIADPMLHPRFIETISVRLGDVSVAATPAAIGIDQQVMLLDLAAPLAGAVPLAFDPDRPGPHQGVTYAQGNGRWSIRVGPAVVRAFIEHPDRPRQSLPAAALIVDGQGQPVTLCFQDESDVDDAWKRPPANWALLSAADLQALLAKLEKTLDAGVLRVALSFRSPGGDPMDREMMMYGGCYSAYGPQNQGGATERNVPGVLIDDQRLLVLSMLPPKVTARLERIRVFTPAGDELPAIFAGSLKDYGAFVVGLEKPLPGALLLRDGPITALRGKLVLGADLAIKGEQRIGYVQSMRLTGFELGKWNRIYPSVQRSYRFGYDDGNDTPGTYLFDTDLRLVALPLAIRPKSTISDRDAWRDSRQTALIPVEHLSAALVDLSAHLDPHNLPLSEEQENRLAWVGVELQAMDSELARINNVSDQTRDGQSGALVSYVYPDSPAAAAGLEMGDILLRVLPEGHPKPVEVQLDGGGRYFGEGGFPWEHYDQMPAEYLERMPRPWPSAASPLNRMLTELGFGRRFDLELARDGKVLSLAMQVVEGPRHFDSAPRFKSEAMGLTVREMTYEVRRYFQRGSDDPGLILSRLEPGSQAAVAGLRPYEIITHVNDQPVKTVTDFQTLAAAGGELRLAVLRMNKGRIAKLRLPQAPPATE